VKLLLTGIIVSGLFLFLTFKGVSIAEITDSLTNSEVSFLFPVISLCVLLTIIRSLRWGVIVNPVKRISQMKLYPISCVGAFAIIMAPLRIGEIIRPFLLHRESKIPFSSAVATVFIERILDFVIALGLLFFVLIGPTMQNDVLVRNSKYFMGIALFLCFFTILFFKKKTLYARIISLINRVTPKRKDQIINIFNRFIDGFKIVGDKKRFFTAFMLTFIYWYLSGVLIYLLFRYKNLNLSISTAFLVLILTMLGISLPTAPGLIGNFQVGSVVALTLTGVEKSEAVAFSIVFYIIGIGVDVILGLIFLPFIKISLKEIKHAFKKYVD